MCKPKVLAWFQECQRKLDHKLSLDSYLLKPVQRITKYQLLLKVGSAATVARPPQAPAGQVSVPPWGPVPIASCPSQAKGTSSKPVLRLGCLSRSYCAPLLGVLRTQVSRRVPVPVGFHTARPARDSV